MPIRFTVVTHWGSTETPGMIRRRALGDEAFAGNFRRHVINYPPIAAVQIAITWCGVDQRYAVIESGVEKVIHVRFREIRVADLACSKAK